MSGHFDSPDAGGNGPAVLTYETVIATHTSDAKVSTLTGGTANSSNIDQFDYGIVSTSAGSGPPGNKPYVKDQLYFQVKLSGTTDRSTVLNGIQANAVGLAFDSPNASTIPEPSSLWSLFGALAITVGWWRRRKAR